MIKLLNLPIWDLFKSTDDLREILSSDLFKNNSFERGDVIIKEKQKDRKLYLIIKGIARAYINDGDLQHTIAFDSEGSYMACPENLLLNMPANRTIVALSNMDLLEIDFDILEKLKAEGDERLMNFEVQLYKKIILDDSKARCKTYTFKDSLEQYADFEKKYEPYMRYISDKHIASYLQINPVSLSRIKKRLKEVGKF